MCGCVLDRWKFSQVSIPSHLASLAAMAASTGGVFKGLCSSGDRNLMEVYKDCLRKCPPCARQFSEPSGTSSPSPPTSPPGPTTITSPAGMHRLGRAPSTQLESVADREVQPGMQFTWP